MNCELCGENNHLYENCYQVLFCKKCKRTNHRTCDHAEFMSSMNINQYHTGQGESSSRSRPSRPTISFPSCIHCGYNDHKFDDCVYYPICEICGSYDHDTHGHNMIISLRRGIKPKNPQHVTKSYETCGSTVHITSDHNDIEWFRKRETLKAKKAESFKASKTESSSALRSKTPTKRVEDTSVQNTILIRNSFLSIPSMVTLAPQDIWSQVKHIELVNIIGNLGAGMLTRAMAKELGAASAHECLFVDFLSEEEPKKIEQSERGIPINQENYVNDLLKKFDISGSSMKTQMVPPNKLRPDLNGKAVNETQYRGIIGSLMYLTASRHDIQFLTCLCARYQPNPKESHLIAVKRIFRKSTSAEAEDVAVARCCANILWIKSQLTDYDIIYEKIKNHTLKKDIEFHFIPTQYQLADIFIKLLDKPSFKRLIDELGMLNIDSKPEASVLTEEN
ncbi:hypothetical protein Tco_1367332 [Tanacetum coccineum]